MKAIIGLGNPGEKYEQTRHNAGFLAVDFLSHHWDTSSFGFEKKFNADVSKNGEAGFLGFLNRSKKLLVKPQTFMNHSGQSVGRLVDFYDLSPKDLVVIHDDIDLPLGQFKVATDSRAAGHNGVQDVINHLNTQEFKRIRIGIRPENDELLKKIGTKDFVLQKFSEDEQKRLQAVFLAIIDEV